MRPADGPACGRIRIALVRDEWFLGDESDGPWLSGQRGVGDPAEARRVFTRGRVRCLLGIGAEHAPGEMLACAHEFGERRQ
jgi:hypothetical protein